MKQALVDPAFPEIVYRRGASGRWQAVVGNTAVRVQTIALAHTSWQMSLPEIAAEYGLSEAQVTQAWAFYQTYQSEIDFQIAYEASLERQYEDMARALKQNPHLLAHSGTLKWPQDALSDQQQLRDEWT